MWPEAATTQSPARFRQEGICEKERGKRGNFGDAKFRPFLNESPEERKGEHKRGEEANSRTSNGPFTIFSYRREPGCRGRGKSVAKKKKRDMGDFAALPPAAQVNDGEKEGGPANQGRKKEGEAIILIYHVFPPLLSEKKKETE